MTRFEMAVKALMELPHHELALLSAIHMAQLALLLGNAPIAAAVCAVEAQRISDESLYNESQEVMDKVQARMKELVKIQSATIRSN